MPSGHRSGGVDFDDLFEPEVGGNGVAAASLRSGGVALRYAARALGSKRANVGVSHGGSDVSNLWAAKGSVAYYIDGLQGRNFLVTEQALSAQGSVSASMSISFAANGTWSVTGETTAGAASIPAPASGSWNTFGGAGSAYQVLITHSITGSSDRQITNGASGWVSLSSTRSLKLELPPIPASNRVLRLAGGEVRVQIRRAADQVVVSDTRFDASVSTNGFE